MVFKIILQVIIQEFIPEPFTPEPVESYSKDDIDEFVDAYCQIAEEAYTTPQVVKEAPHHAALGSRIQEDGLIEWKKFATTWRAYIKMKKDSLPMKQEGGEKIIGM